MAAQKPKPQPGGPEHVMDYDNLDLGHPAVSKSTVTLVDLDAYVYGLEEIKGRTKPVSIIMIAHGWANRASQLDKLAAGILGEMNKLEQAQGERQRDVLIVTLDQRNHGERRRIKDGSNFDTYPMRLPHMAVTVTGGVQDHLMLIQFLPSYLFPGNERVVSEFMSAGISMGGHITWRLLRDDPRVRIGVPIISIPPSALGPLLTTRPRRHNTLGTDVPFPKGTREWFEYKEPPGTYADKKVLALHGALDRMLPVKFGDERWKEIESESRRAGDAVRVVQEDRGHVVSPEMVQLAAEWFWRWGVAGSASLPTAVL